MTQHTRSNLNNNNNNKSLVFQNKLTPCPKHDATISTKDILRSLFSIDCNGHCFCDFKKNEQRVLKKEDNINNYKYEDLK